MSKDFDEFKKISVEIKDVEDKAYAKDLFSRISEKPYREALSVENNDD